jgi:putative DNA primase/helicase
VSAPYRDAAHVYRQLGWQGALPVGLEIDENKVSHWLPRRKSNPPAGYTGYDGGWPSNRDIGQWVRRRGHCNIGLRVPDGFLGVDVDQYHAKRGLDNMLAYGRERDLTHLPLSDTIRTTSRGHGPSAISWLRVPEGRRWRDQPVPGVEVIQYGHRYAVVWPSVHPSGAVYQWLHLGETIDPPSPDDARFLWLPDDWVDDLTVPEPERADHPPADEHREDDWADEVRDLLERAAAALWTAGTSAHGEARKYAMRLLRMEQEGRPGATAALDELEEVFVTVVTDPRRGGDTRTEREARAEWARMAGESAREKVRTTKDPKPAFDDLSWVGAPLDSGAPPGGGRTASPRKPGQYFKKGVGLLVATLADDILALGPLAEGVDDIMWSYSGGVWSPDRHVVRARAARLLGQQYRRAHGANAEDVVRARAPRITCDPVSEVTNFRNGLYLWQADQLRDHDPAVLSTVQLAVEWNPDATCPAFDRWLAQVVHKDMVALVWEAIGYLLYSGNPLHRAYMLMGGGRNGKGTLLRVLGALIGAANYTAVSLHSLVNTRFSTANLFGKLANIAGDIDGTYLESTAMFKAITGQDQITAEHKGRDAFDFTPWAVPVFSANKVPPSADVTQGYLSRWLVIPFPNDFTGREDRRLDARLQTKAELQGIAVKAMPALRALMERGDFDLPKTGRAARDEFARRVDQVRMWVDECCSIGDAQLFAPRSELYRHYRDWAIRDGHKAVKASEFYDRLDTIPGVTATRHHGGIRGYENIKVIDRAEVTLA